MTELTEHERELEKIIADLVRRKKTARPAEKRMLNRALNGLRYTYENAGGIGRTSILSDGRLLLRKVLSGNRSVHLLHDVVELALTEGCGGASNHLTDTLLIASTP
jgi:hypothetical protein